MKKSIKAALYSGLLFPGTGHFSLDRYPRGMVFFVPAISSIVFLVHNALGKAFAITDQIARGEIPADTATITGLISTAPGGTELLMLKIATWAWLVSWLGSVIDAYRIGKAAEREQGK